MRANNLINFNGQKYLVENDYTAWEIYANNATIPVGSNSILGGYVTTAISAQMTQAINIRTSKYQNNKNDVIVDWGDGSTSSIKKQEYTNRTENDNEYVHVFEHTYITPGKYIVKVLGKDYFSVNHAVEYIQGDSSYGKNLLCRCFDVDLPIASHITNISSFAVGARRLLKINIPPYEFFKNVCNFSRCLYACRNLITATGFDSPLAKVYTVANMFMNDNNLTTCDFKLPCHGTRDAQFRSVFENCTSLTGDIADFFPPTGFSNKNINLERTFFSCSSLTGTIPSSLLWECTDKVFNGTNCFNGCNNNIRSQAPISWGGSNDNIIIPLSMARTDVMPQPSAYYLNKVLTYTGQSSNSYVAGKSYRCVYNREQGNLGLSLDIWDEDRQYDEDWGDRVYSATAYFQPSNKKIKINQFSFYFMNQQGALYINFYGKDLSTNEWEQIGNITSYWDEYEDKVLSITTEEEYVEYKCEIIPDDAIDWITTFNNLNVKYTADNYTWQEISTKSDKVGTVSNIKAYICADKAFFLWTDPSDKIIINQEVVAEWDKTVLVGKKGSYPTSPTDGDYIFTSTNYNQYKNSPAMIQSYDGEFDMSYKWRWFTVTKFGVVNDDSNSVRSSTDFTWEELKMMLNESNASSYNLKQYFQLGDIVTVSNYDWQVVDILPRGMKLMGYKGLQNNQAIDAAQSTFEKTQDIELKRSDYCLALTYSGNSILSNMAEPIIDNNGCVQLFYLTDDNSGKDRIWRTINRRYEIKFVLNEASNSSGFKLIDRNDNSVLLDWSQFDNTGDHKPEKTIPYEVNETQNIVTDDTIYDDERQMGETFTQKPSVVNLSFYSEWGSEGDGLTVTLEGESDSQWYEIGVLSKGRNNFNITTDYTNYRINAREESFDMYHITVDIKYSISMMTYDVPFDTNNTGSFIGIGVYEYPNYFVETSNSFFKSYTKYSSSLNERTIDDKVYKRIDGELNLDSNTELAFTTAQVLYGSNSYDGWAGGIPFTVSQVSSSGGSQAWQAMNGGNDVAHTTRTSYPWWKIEFDIPVKITSFKRNQDETGATYTYATSFKFQGSNDNSFWTDLLTFSVNNTQTNEYTIASPSYYKYYRVYCTQTSKYMINNRLEFTYTAKNFSSYPNVLKTLVHTPHNLTANPTLATNGFTFSASSTLNDAGVLYEVMDGEERKSGSGGQQHHFHSKSEAHPWFAIEFTESQTFDYLIFGTRNSTNSTKTVTNLFLQYSDNGTDWTNGGDFNPDISSTHCRNTIFKRLNNDATITSLGSHKYWRIYSESSGYLIIGELELGRIINNQFTELLYEYQPDYTLQRTTGGGNDYENSEVDQYLNTVSNNFSSVFTSNSIFQKYSGFSGKTFQYGMDKDFLDCVCESSIDVFAGIYPNGKHILKRKFYLPSATEVGHAMSDRYFLGNSFAFFKGADSNSNIRKRLSYSGSGYVNYWTRTAIGTPKRYGIIMTNGNYGSLDARGNNTVGQNNSLGNVIPVCTIGQDYQPSNKVAAENLSFEMAGNVEADNYYPINQDIQGGFTLMFTVNNYSDCSYDFMTLISDNYSPCFMLQHRDSGNLEIETQEGSDTLFNDFPEEGTHKVLIVVNNTDFDEDTGSYQMEGYIDGVQRSSCWARAYSTIECFQTSHSNISNVYIWNRVLTGAEIDSAFEM